MSHRREPIVIRERRNLESFIVYSVYLVVVSRKDDYMVVYTTGRVYAWIARGRESLLHTEPAIRLSQSQYLLFVKFINLV